MMAAKPCRTCRAPIVMVRKAENHTSWIPVEVDQVSPGAVRDESTVRALRDLGTHRTNVHAYTLPHLREALGMALSFERGARQSVDDFPWHVVHQCERGGR